jgi:hypothetical protein
VHDHLSSHVMKRTMSAHLGGQCVGRAAIARVEPAGAAGRPPADFPAVPSDA